MNRPPITAARFPEILHGPPEAAAAWNAFSAYVVDPPVRATFATSDHVLSLQLSGTCRLRQEVQGRSDEGWCGPGTVQVIPARIEATWEGREHAGASRAIALFVPQDFLTRVISQGWSVEPGGVEIIRRLNARDQVMESLLLRLAFEAKNGSPSGSIYAESACEFLAHHLIQAHSSLASPPPPSSGGLPARRLKIVLEYIEDNIAQPMTLRRLAELSGVSARHFERAFRQALGVPPHAYVLQKRVAAARYLLTSRPVLAIHEIAACTGFSSSSHLAAAFRRQVGCSPGTYRSLHTH